jgi:hypothetical protein
MENFHNCDSYINIPSSQTYKQWISNKKKDHKNKKNTVKKSNQKIS